MDNEILVLAIGNDIIGDDGVAFEVAKILQDKFPEYIDFENVYGGGLEILDFIEGKKKTLVLDSISTGLNPIGTILEFGKDDFQYFNTSSPHYIGLPEVLKLSSMFNIDFPDEIKILALEIEVQNNIIEELSPFIQEQVPKFVNSSAKILSTWIEEIKSELEIEAM